MSTNDPGDARDVRHDSLVGRAGDDYGGRSGIDSQGGFDLPGVGGSIASKPDSTAAGKKRTLTPQTIAACITLWWAFGASNTEASGLRAATTLIATRLPPVDPSTSSQARMAFRASATARSSASKQCECSTGDPKRA